MDSIRISARNFGFENNTRSIPLYAVFAMRQIVKLRCGVFMELMASLMPDLFIRLIEKTSIFWHAGIITMIIN